MNELLDEPLVVPSRSIGMTGTINGIGLLLVAVWSGLLYEPMDLLYWMKIYSWSVDFLFLVIIYLLLSHNNKRGDTFTRVKVEAYQKYILFLVLAVGVSYFFTIAPMQWILKDIARIGLSYCCSRIVILFYKQEPPVTSMWYWLINMASFWGLLLVLLVLFNYVDQLWNFLSLGMLHSLFFFLSLSYSIFFYNQFLKGPSAAVYKRPVACFIISAQLISIGHINNWDLEYERILVVLGVGCCLLVALYAWIKQIDAPTTIK